MAAERRTDPRRRCRGQALVESAFVLLTTIALILGVLDVGQVIMQIQHMDERARAAARWASTHTSDATSIKNYACYGTAAGKSGKGFMGLMPSHVTVTATTETITVSITKPLALYTPYLSQRFTPRPAVAVSPVESLGANN